jgi:hypothetical protein
MKRTIRWILGSVATLACVASAGLALAQDGDGDGGATDAPGAACPHRGEGRGPGPHGDPEWAEERAALLDRIEISVENTDDGVIVTRRSDDPEAVAHLHEFAARHGERGHGRHRPEDVAVEVELLDDGVAMTISSTNPERVSEIQEMHADGMPPGGPGHHRGHHGRHGRGHGHGHGPADGAGPPACAGAEGDAPAED